MSTKKSFVMRIDVKKFKALEKWADEEFRSLNAQIEFIIDEALRKSGRFRGKREEESEKEN